MFVYFMIQLSAGALTCHGVPQKEAMASLPEGYLFHEKDLSFAESVGGKDTYNTDFITEALPEKIN